MAYALQEVPDHIPRFAWRVESAGSHYRILRPQEQPGGSLSNATNADLRDYVSAHMLWNPYAAPFAIASLTGSLLWALNYAHWLLRKGYFDIEILLIDTQKIPERTIYPASFLVRHLEITPRGKSWHDNPYHEYLAFGLLPGDVVLRAVGLQSSNGPEINTLLPRFNNIHIGERLHDSLHIFRAGWKNVFGDEVDGIRVTDEEINAARLIASKFVVDSDKALHFQVAMMFLSLQKRVWDDEAFSRVREEFEGATIPKHYLYKSWASMIEPEMEDVVEWVKSMEQIRFECAKAKALTRLRLRRSEEARSSM